MRIKERGKKLTQGKQWLKAYFTVEASLLMGVILPVLFALLIAGFYVHDRACMQGAVCELCAMSSNLQVYYGEREGLLDTRASGLSGSVSLWARSRSYSASISEDAGEAYLAGSFPVSPGGADRFLGRQTAVEISWYRRIYHPADLIRKVRGVHALLEGEY